MISPGYLIAVLALLALGIIATSVSIWRKIPFAGEIPLVVTGLILPVWIIAGLDLPMRWPWFSWISERPMVVWIFHVNDFAWSTSLALIILMTAYFLINRPDYRSSYDETLPRRYSAVVRLLLIATGLVAIWADTLPGLVSGWTLFSLVWVVFFWSNAEGENKVRDLIRHTSGLLVGITFLYLAEATNSATQTLSIDQPGWSDLTTTFMFLAGFTFLGAIPFDWWRPVRQSLVIQPQELPLIQLLPSIIGGTLLAQLAEVSGSILIYQLFATTFGLVGLLIGSGRVLTRFGAPRRALSGLILAQAGMAALTSAWTDGRAVVGMVTTLILAVGGLYLTLGMSIGRFPWFVIVPIGALAGLPLTAGFQGLVPLYNGWLNNGLFPLVLVTGLLYIPFVAATSIAWWQERKPGSLLEIDAAQRILTLIGMGFISIGLLTISRMPLTEIHVVVFLVLGLSTISGLFLGYFTARGLLVGTGLQDALRVKLPGRSLVERGKAITPYFSRFLREVLGVLEGEGGMIWLVVLIIVIWLAGRG